MTQASTDYLARYASRFTLEPSRAACVVIDLQHATGSRTSGLGRLLEDSGCQHDGVERFDRIERVVLPNVARLLPELRSAGVPILYLVLGAAHPDYLDIAPHLRPFVRAVGNRVGTREHEILDAVSPEADDIVMRKTTISGFASTGIGAALRAMGRSQLLAMGVSTNACVDQTAREAVERGFDTALVEDCCAAATDAFHRGALASFGRVFGRVVSSDTVLEALR